MSRRERKNWIKNICTKQKTRQVPGEVERKRGEENQQNTEGEDKEITTPEGVSASLKGEPEKQGVQGSR